MRKAYLTFESEEEFKLAKRIGIYYDHVCRAWYTTDIVTFRKVEEYYKVNGFKFERPKKEPTNKVENKPNTNKRKKSNKTKKKLYK